MTMLAQSLSVESMADSLQLLSFGKWANSGDNLKMLGSLPSVMFKEYRPYAYPNEPTECIPDMNEDRAIELDEMISQLPQIERKVLLLYYVGRMSYRGISRILHCSRRTVENARTQAITRLYTIQQCTLG